MNRASPQRRARAPVSAYEQALRLIARRDHSEKELITKLSLRGHSSGETRAAVTRLREHGFLDDRRYAEGLVRSRVGQGYGPRRIDAELRTHGLAASAIRAVLVDAAVDWHAAARTAALRHFGETPVTDLAERARRAQFLLRRGFDPATVRSVTRADCGDPGDELD